MAGRLSESVGPGPGAEAEDAADSNAKRDVLEHFWFVPRGGAGRERRADGGLESGAREG